MGRTLTVHSFGAATRTGAGAGDAIRTAAYDDGQLYIYILSMSGTNPRLRPRWESAAGDVRGAVSPYASLRSLGTLLATGVSVFTLSNLGAWGRLGWAVGGTGGAIKFQSWFVGSW